MRKDSQRTVPSPVWDCLRSDLLPTFVGLIEAFPALKPLLPEIIRVNVVLDANIAQAELRWRLQRRRVATSRTALHEALVSKVLIAFAPLYLHDDISEHMERIARETGTAVSDVEREWSAFSELLHFCAPKEAGKTDVTRLDPDDTPYVRMIDYIAAQAIYTKDNDFEATSVPLLQVSIDTMLRSYARASTTRIAIAFGSTISITFGLEMLLGGGVLYECWFRPYAASHRSRK